MISRKAGYGTRGEFALRCVRTHAWACDTQERHSEAPKRSIPYSRLSCTIFVCPSRTETETEPERDREGEREARELHREIHARAWKSEATSRSS